MVIPPEQANYNEMQPCFTIEFALEDELESTTYENLGSASEPHFKIYEDDFLDHLKNTNPFSLLNLRVSLTRTTSFTADCPMPQTTGEPDTFTVDYDLTPWDDPRRKLKLQNKYGGYASACSTNFRYNGQICIPEPGTNTYSCANPDTNKYLPPNFNNLVSGASTNPDIITGCEPIEFDGVVFLAKCDLIERDSYVRSCFLFSANQEYSSQNIPDHQ